MAMDNIVMRPLHDGTAALVLGLGSVRIFALIDLEKKTPMSAISVGGLGVTAVAYRTPYGGNHEVASVVAVSNQPKKK